MKPNFTIKLKTIFYISSIIAILFITYNCDPKEEPPVIPPTVVTTSGTTMTTSGTTMTTSGTTMTTSGTMMTTSGCPMITSGSNMTTSGCPMTITSNPMTITSNPMAITSNPMAITYAPIPDNNFRNVILNCINRNGERTVNFVTNNSSNLNCTESYDGMINPIGGAIKIEVLKSITKISYGQFPSGRTKVDFDKISTLGGIEYMTNLTHLNVADNLIMNVDVSKNTKLDTLNIKDNNLRSLDLSNNTELRTLITTNNPNLSCIKVSPSQLSGGTNVITSISKDPGHNLSTVCN